MKKKPRTVATQDRKDVNVKRSSKGKFKTAAEMMEAGAKNKNYKSVDDMKTKAVTKSQRDKQKRYNKKIERKDEKKAIS